MDSEDARTWGQTRYGHAARSADELLRWALEQALEERTIERDTYWALWHAAIEVLRAEQRKSSGLIRQLRERTHGR